MKKTRFQGKKGRRGGRSAPLSAGALAACQPALPDMDWGLLRQTPILFAGVGAVGRPLAEGLAFAGMTRCVVADLKRYGEKSLASQCEASEVGRPKAIVVAERLQSLGVAAAPLVEDIDDIPPGYVEPGCVIVASVDNRRADICAGQLAARMRTIFVKVNVEPTYLMASVRALDLQAERPEICPECQMSDRLYRDQQHPASCDGGGAGRPTGSPRALCRLAADSAALIVAQIIGSPHWLARRWLGRQWQQMMLRGRSSLLELAPKQNCRWRHGEHWRNLERLGRGPAALTLADLAARTPAAASPHLRVRVSGRVAMQSRCLRCARPSSLPRWAARLQDPLGSCPCGGQLVAEPFFTGRDFPAQELESVWTRPLTDWGAPPRSIIALEEGDRQWSFVVGDAG